MFIALITPDFSNVLAMFDGFFSGLQTTAVGVDETRG